MISSQHSCLISSFLRTLSLLFYLPWYINLLFHSLFHARFCVAWLWLCLLQFLPFFGIQWRSLKNQYSKIFKQGGNDLKNESFFLWKVVIMPDIPLTLGHLRFDLAGRLTILPPFKFCVPSFSTYLGKLKCYPLFHYCLTIDAPKLFLFALIDYKAFVIFCCYHVTKYQGF